MIKQRANQDDARRELAIFVIFFSFFPLISCSDGQPIKGPQFPQGALDDSDFEKMGKPKPGEWLYSFKEEFQSFEDYKKACFNRKTDKRNIIYIQPLGTFNEKYKKIFTIMREYSETFFNCKTVLLEPIGLFEGCYDRSRKQYHATKIMDRLELFRNENAVAFIGITNKDLYSNNLNFVFGQGSLSKRLGVYSLVRLENEDEVLFLRRSLQLMAHEMGHIFSITHCVKYKCLMCGANSLTESDSHPLHLCPIDLQKLQWNVGFQVKTWYGKLHSFYKTHGLVEEEKRIGKRLKRLE